MTDNPRSPERPLRPSAARRDRARTSRPALARTSFLERNRRLILGAVGVAALLVIAAFATLSAVQPAYACAEQWAPTLTNSPAPGSSPRLGNIQPDLGKNHIATGQTVRYALCPPASGRHYNQNNVGPIKPQVYGPDDTAIPQGWLHNMEHGSLVVLYRCPGEACTDAGQAAFRQFFASFPASPICKLPAGAVGPVIARFDQMAFPYAALLWGQVLPLDTFDQALILAFFAQQAERSNPEAGCPAPTPTAGPSTPAPSGSAGASPAASGTPAVSPAASASPGASPATSPAASPAPTASPAASSGATASPAPS